MHRLFAFGLALTFATSAFAQEGICTNGTATFQGVSYACDEVDVTAVLPVGTDGPFRTGALNDIWGWTDPQDGSEYALVGTRSGVVFVDVTVPTAPRVLGKLQTSIPQGFSTWRDVKTDGNYAFVVSEAGGHGMQVFDLTRLRGLSENSQRDFVEDALYTGFGSAHNIVVDDVSGFAYGVGANGPDTSTCGGGGLHIVDIRTPTSPTFAGCFDNDGYTHDAQCVVYSGPDTEHQGKQICVASNEDTITIVDVTDKANPIQLSRGFYPNPSYTHQGWFTEDQRYFLVDDELDSSSSGTRSLIFDLSDLDSPSFEFEYFAPNPTTDHNLYVRGDYAFMSNYESGLRIVDITGIESGVFAEDGFFDTYPQGNSASFGGQWSNYPYFESGTVVASDQNNGLFVLRPAPKFVSVASEEETPEASAFSLSSPEPNPSSAQTSLALSVAETQAVRAAVYDLSGREVASLLDRTVASGEALTLSVDAASLPAGVYVVRVVGETFDTSRRLTVVR